MDFDRTSYFFGCLSTFLMAAYLVTLQHTGMKDKISSTDILYINSCNCFPFILLLSLSKKFRNFNNGVFCYS